MKNPSKKEGRKKDAPREEKGAKLEARNGRKARAGSRGPPKRAKKSEKRGAEKEVGKKMIFGLIPVSRNDGPAACGKPLREPL